MKQHKNRLIIIACMIAVFKLHSQNDLIYSSDHVGFNISANLAFGTHFQRLGINFNFFYVNRHFQANSEVRSYFNFKNLGPKKMYPELVLSQGVLFAYGNEPQWANPFINSVSNQTYYRNSVAYSYNAYFNAVKTTQQTGLVALQFNKITVITENDILARPQLDRFRTGAFLMQYQHEDKWQAAINCTMWTGKMGNRTAIAGTPIRSGCYMDTTGGVYSNLSHGLLSAQFKYNIAYSQNIQANVGIDAEQVRNAVQNKFIHDMKFLPKKWQAKNCHLPMIDSTGHLFLYKEGQTVRKPRLYLNAFSNASVFY